MPKIQIEYKDEKLDKAIKLHQLRYDFVTKAEAIVDALKKFFSKEDFDYFEKVNKEQPMNQDDPAYIKKMDSNKTKKRRGKK